MLREVTDKDHAELPERFAENRAVNRAVNRAEEHAEKHTEKYAVNLATNLGDRIIYLRKERNLSRHAFAARCGYADSYVAQIEGAQNVPSREFIKRVSQELHISEAWLLGETDELGEGTEKPGDRVRQVRKEKNMSFREFAKSIGSSTSNVQMIEKGDQQLSLRYAQRIGRVHHVSADWLLYGDEKSKNYPCSEELIRYLKRNENIRKSIWEKMEVENGDS